MADLLKDTELRKLDRETKRRTNGWTDRQASRQAGRQTFKSNIQFSKMCISYGGENSICFFDQSFPRLLQTHSLLPYLSMFGDSLDIILKQIS